MLTMNQKFNSETKIPVRQSLGDHIAGILAHMIHNSIMLKYISLLFHAIPLLTFNNLLTIYSRRV